VHHSDRGSQYLSIRYTERLAEAGGVTSVGSRGDSYDNALAETIIGLSRASSSAGPAPGGASTTSSTPRSSGWTGSTTAACSSRSATSLQPSSRPPTTGRRTPTTLPDSKNRASGEPGAIHGRRWGVSFRPSLTAEPPGVRFEGKRGALLLTPGPTFQSNPCARSASNWREVRSAENCSQRLLRSEDGGAESQPPDGT
jgi:hypothetical protein